MKKIFKVLLIIFIALTTITSTMYIYEKVTEPECTIISADIFIRTTYTGTSRVQICVYDEK